LLPFFLESSFIERHSSSNGEPGNEQENQDSDDPERSGHKNSFAAKLAKWFIGLPVY
jgi:hypothetical protein